MNNIIGKRIRDRRKEMHLTQAQLAELINLNPYYISRLETGEKQPSGKVLAALSNILGISADYLLGLESNIVLHEEVSDLEEKIKLLSPSDRKMVLNIVDMLVDRLSLND